jgi:ABC-2 type transport system permease protein
MWVIAHREFLERVRSRWFAAITLLGPIGMVAMVLIPALIAGRKVEGAKVEIIDHSGVLGAPLADGFTKLLWQPKIIAADTPDATEMARIRTNAINGFVTIPADALDTGKIVYRGDNASNQVVQISLFQTVREIVQAERGKRAGISAAQLDKMLQPTFFEAQHTTGEAEGTSGFGSFLISYFLAFILYMVITMYGVGVMRSVVQEKTSRVMELMVATIKPRALMAGKILGVGGAGLVQIVVWLAIGAITLAYREELLGWFGVASSGPGLPTIALGELVIVVVYFVLGFFFYASMYAAVGAMVSSEQDTQQVQLPVTMVLVIGILCVQMVSNDPRGTAAHVMTLVPLWSALLMPMRFMLGGASIGELVLSIAILGASTVLVARAAAKIYRVGVLMYGKRPGLHELLRWLRY